MNKNKILGIVFSNSKQSKGYKFTKDIANKMIERLDGEYEILSTRNHNFNACEGCKHCFKYGTCILEKTDDVLKLKEKIKMADIIILISPSYAINVSGKAKCFIERLNPWFYTMELKGKKGITVCTASNTGTTEVNEYLEKVMYQMGIEVIAKLVLYDYMIYDKEQYDKYVNECVLRIMNPEEKSDVDRYYKYLKNKLEGQNVNEKKEWTAIHEYWNTKSI